MFKQVNSKFKDCLSMHIMIFNLVNDKYLFKRYTIIVKNNIKLVNHVKLNYYIKIITTAVYYLRVYIINNYY
jgi:hypothetical protein